MSSNVERLTITLTSEMAHAVKGAVDSGEYALTARRLKTGPGGNAS